MEDHPVTNLPFVKDTEEGRNFWAVEPMDDSVQGNVDGNEMGADYAMAFMKYLRDESETAGSGGMLFSIAEGICQREDAKEIEVGFCSFLESMLLFAARHCRFEAFREDTRFDLQAYLDAQKKETSKRCRRAALIRWHGKQAVENVTCL